MNRSQNVLGALLAGGASTRYGSPKWRAEVGGRSLAERSLGALAGACDRVVVIGSDPELNALGAPVRADREAGRGPLEGIAVALAWARELELDAAMILACDLPLVTDALLERIIAAWKGEE